MLIKKTISLIFLVMCVSILYNSVNSYAEMQDQPKLNYFTNDNGIVVLNAVVSRLERNDPSVVNILKRQTPQIQRIIIEKAVNNDIENSSGQITLRFSIYGDNLPQDIMEGRRYTFIFRFTRSSFKSGFEIQCEFQDILQNHDFHLENDDVYILNIFVDHIDRDTINGNRYNAYSNKHDLPLELSQNVRTYPSFFYFRIDGNIANLPKVVNIGNFESQRITFRGNLQRVFGGLGSNPREDKYFNYYIHLNEESK